MIFSFTLTLFVTQSIGIHMSSPWFENKPRGTLTVSYEDGSWIVTEPATDTRTVCFFDDEAPDPEIEPLEVDVEIESRRLTTGSGPNYLTVTQLSETTSVESSGSPDHSDSEYPKRTLLDFDGSGEYVTIEATITEIEYVQKEKANMPDVKGTLRESGSSKRLPFVVEDGAGHPYFETGSTFRFEGVKDHRYAKKNEVQVLITKKTRISEL